MTWSWKFTAAGIGEGRPLRFRPCRSHFTITGKGWRLLVFLLFLFFLFRLLLGAFDLWFNLVKGVFLVGRHLTDELDHGRAHREVSLQRLAAFQGGANLIVVALEDLLNVLFGFVRVLVFAMRRQDQRGQMRHGN